MKLQQEAWGSWKGRLARKFMFTADNGFRVVVSDFGATLVSVEVPDKDGKPSHVAFGEDTPDEFIKQGAYFGAKIGRVANRIANARFTLDGVEYGPLARNNAGLHCLHGGNEGFNQKWWEVKKAHVHGEAGTLALEYTSPDGEEGFPGTLVTEIIYTVKPNYVGWTFKATTDKPTIVNLTDHTYWNLESLETTIDDHELLLHCDAYMPGDENNLPTGEVVPVDGTPLDLRKEPKTFARLFDEFGDIDNNFFIERDRDPGTGERDLALAAELYSPRTGRKMVVYTTEPCIQVYTGNYMEGVKTFGGLTCKKHSAVCLETQRVPNAINLPEFRDSVILRPGETYYHKTIHEFIVQG